MSGDMRTFVIVFGVIAAFVFAFFLLFRAYRKRRGELPLRPEGILPEVDPAFVGYVLNGRASRRDVLSLLPHWAENGYIEMCLENGTLSFVQARDLPPEAEDYEILMMNRLFEPGEAEQPQGFRKNIAETRRRVNVRHEEPVRKLYKKVSQMIQDAVHMLAAFPVAAMAGMAAFRAGVGDIPLFLVIVGLFFGVYALSMSWTRLLRTRRYGKNHSNGSLLAWILCAAVLYGGVGLVAFMAVGPWWWFAPGVSLLMALMAPALEVRTEYGEQWLAYVMGVKLFMLSAQPPALAEAERENPGYFFRMLPYAWVLGVEDVWAQKFAGEIKEPPLWFQGGDTNQFSLESFTAELTRMLEDKLKER